MSQNIRTTTLAIINSGSTPVVMATNNSNNNNNIQNFSGKIATNKKIIQTNPSTIYIYIYIYNIRRITPVLNSKRNRRGNAFELDYLGPKYVMHGNSEMTWGHLAKTLQLQNLPQLPYEANQGRGCITRCQPRTYVLCLYTLTCTQKYLLRVDVGG